MSRRCAGNHPLCGLELSQLLTVPESGTRHRHGGCLVARRGLKDKRPEKIVKDAALQGRGEVCGGQELLTSLGSSLWPARSLKSGGLHSCDHAVNSRAARRGTAPAGAHGGFPLGSSKDRASAGLLQQHRAPAPASSSPPFPQPPCTWELQ